MKTPVPDLQALRVWLMLVVLGIVLGLAGWGRFFTVARSETGAPETACPEVRFVTVEDDVRLELLDWGGSGQPVVLLAGSGNSAHVFDDFARTCCRCSIQQG